jgi:hypothetical protein
MVCRLLGRIGVLPVVHLRFAESPTDPQLNSVFFPLLSLLVQERGLKLDTAHSTGSGDQSSLLVQERGLKSRQCVGMLHKSSRSSCRSVG